MNPHLTMTVGELRERLERVFMAATGSPNPHGTVAWAARALPYARPTLTRWLSGGEEDEAPPRAVVCLHHLELVFAERLS